MGIYRQTKLLFCFCCICFSGPLTGGGFESYLDVKFLKEQGENPPDWMLEKVRGDLEPYRQVKLKPELIEKARQKQPVKLDRLIVRPKEGIVQFAAKEGESPNSWRGGHKEYLERAVSFLVDQGLVTYDAGLLFHLGHSPLNHFSPEGDHPPIFRTAMSPKDDPENRLTILFPNVRELHRKRNQGFKAWQKVLQEGLGVTWEDKKPLLFWRGGIRPYDDSYYPGSTKELSAALHRLADHPRSKLVKLSEAHQSINAHYVKVRVNNKIPGYNKTVKSTYREGKFVSLQDQLEYKYLISVDGHSNPSAVTWQLLSHSACLKQEPCYRQFFSPCRIIPRS